MASRTLAARVGACVRTLRAVAAGAAERTGLAGGSDPRSRWAARLLAVVAGAAVVLGFNHRVLATVPADVVLATVGPTVVLVAATALLTGWHRRAMRCRGTLRRRVAAIAPWALVLAAVFGFNAYVRPQLQGLSWALELHLTDPIYDFEGTFVAGLQALSPEPLVLYLSAVYVVGYGLLLFFPPMAYVVLDEYRHAGALLLAYALNYLVGSLCYVLVVAHGPRNFLYAQVEQPLYSTFPEVMHLTSAVNSNSNVFPSLHTAMAVTVLLFAAVTREEYPRWFAIAAVLAPSVVLATMVLGIHWFADVAAGAVLAVGCTVAARWTVARVRDRQPRSGRARALVGR